MTAPTEYRSPNASPGCFREVETVHLHIDGGGSPDLLALITNVIKSLEERDCPGKTSTIRRAVKGPQREDSDCRETYAAHTPGTSAKETFKMFSPTTFSHRHVL